MMPIHPYINQVQDGKGINVGLCGGMCFMPEALERDSSYKCNFA
jgi:hypothetical protein